MTDPAEFEETIPLTRGRGHIYYIGPGWAGVWLNSGTPTAMMKRLKADFPDMVIQQVGQGEGSFRIPEADLSRLLPVLKPFRRRRLPEEQKAACAERLRPHRFKRVRKPGGCRRSRIDDRPAERAKGALKPELVA